MLAASKRFFCIQLFTCLRFDHIAIRIQHMFKIFSYHRFLFSKFFIFFFHSNINSTVDYDYNDMKNSTAPIYKYLIDSDPNLNILIFSGDDDAVCSTLGTQNWVRLHLQFHFSLSLTLHSNLLRHSRTNLSLYITN